jgi:hypothetical protein
MRGYNGIYDDLNSRRTWSLSSLDFWTCSRAVASIHAFDFYSVRTFTLVASSGRSTKIHRYENDEVL